MTSPQHSTVRRAADGERLHAPNRAVHRAEPARSGDGAPLAEHFRHDRDDDAGGRAAAAARRGDGAGRWAARGPRRAARGRPPVVGEGLRRRPGPLDAARHAAPDADRRARRRAGRRRASTSARVRRRTATRCPGVYVLPRARRRGVGRAISRRAGRRERCHGLPGTADSVHELDEASLAAAAPAGLRGDGSPPRVAARPRHPRRRGAEASVERAEARRVRAATAARRRGRGGLAGSSTTSPSRPGRTRPDAEGSTEQLPYSVFRGFLPDPSYVLHGVARRRAGRDDLRDGPGQGRRPSTRSSPACCPTRAAPGSRPR